MQQSSILLHSFSSVSVSRSVSRPRSRSLGHLCEGTECDLEPDGELEDLLRSLARARRDEVSFPRSSLSRRLLLPPPPALLRPRSSPRSLSRLLSRRECWRLDLWKPGVGFVWRDARGGGGGGGKLEDEGRSNFKFHAVNISDHMRGRSGIGRRTQPSALYTRKIK